jgi:hypothetical protein
LITVGFSAHHVEAIPYIRKEMEDHELVILEDAPSVRFRSMLRGEVSINDYIMEGDSGFPEFERSLCRVLRTLHHEGRRIIQVEPYLERLVRIHELFAEEKTPADVMAMAELGEVYLAEKAATGALISFYSLSIKGGFDAVVEAVMEFARLDAQRLTLRERLRAQAVACLVRSGEKAYVEAGYIHYLLYRYLRKELGGAGEVRPVFPLMPVIRRLGGKRRNMGPGDILTLHYIFHHKLRENVARLLAARSLIYIKLIEKQELVPGQSDAPHSEDMVRAGRITDRLDYDACRELFEKIRLAKRESALKFAQSYVEPDTAKHAAWKELPVLHK